MHKKAFTVTRGREHATQSIVKIADLDMSLIGVRWNKSVVSVGPELYHGFPGSYQADFFCPSSKSSVNLSIFDYENVPCFPALQVHCQTFNISVFALFCSHSNTFRTVWLVSPKILASALPKMHFLLLCHC